MTNFADRTIWTGDNLDILRALNSASVDLIYLDPPFNSNQNFAAPVGSAAGGAASKDTWTLPTCTWPGWATSPTSSPQCTMCYRRPVLRKARECSPTCARWRCSCWRCAGVLKDTGLLPWKQWPGGNNHCAPVGSDTIACALLCIHGRNRPSDKCISKSPTGPIAKPVAGPR